MKDPQSIEHFTLSFQIIQRTKKMPSYVEFGLLLTVVLFIWYLEDNKNSTDEVLSELCTEVKDEFSKKRSTFHACRTNFNSDADACSQCGQYYMDIHHSFGELESLMKNRTCPDISDEQSTIEEDEKLWSKSGCTYSGWWNDLLGKPFVFLFCL